MCGGGSAPPAPDYTPIANAQEQSSSAELAAMQQEMAQQQTQFNTYTTQQAQQYQQALAASTAQATQNNSLEQQQLALEQQAQTQGNQLSEQQLADYQQAQSQANSIASANENAYSQVASAQSSLLGFDQSSAQQEYGDWQQNVAPVLNQYEQSASTYDNPANEALNSGQAVAATSQSYDSARLGALQSLESYGVDPTSTRYAALDVGMRTGEAAAEAAAGTQSIINTKNTGLSLEGNAAQVGNSLLGYSNQAAGNASAAGGAQVNALNSGVNAAQEVASGTAGGLGAINANTLSSINADNNVLQGELGTGAANQNLLGSTQGWMQQGLSSLGMSDNMIGTYGGLSNSSLSGAANTLNTGFSNSLNSFNATQQAGSGIGSLFGTAAGIGAMAYMEHGGAVPAVSDIRGGGPIHPSMSPSQGKAVDDVNLRGNVGEFVTPKDVVSWKGEEFFHKLITKAREERAQVTQASGAVPVVRTVSPIPQGAVQSALPVR